VAKLFRSVDRAYLRGSPRRWCHRVGWGRPGASSWSLRRGGKRCTSWRPRSRRWTEQSTWDENSRFKSSD